MRLLEVRTHEIPSKSFFQVVQSELSFSLFLVYLFVAHLNICAGLAVQGVCAGFKHCH